MNLNLLFCQDEVIIPPGTLKLNDSVFIDKSPVSNIMFSEYLNVRKVLKNKGYNSFNEFTAETNESGFPLEFRILRIPSPLLIEFYANDNFLNKKGYATESKYTDFPVLNVPKTTAMDYCKWRTEMVAHLWMYDEKYATVKDLAKKIVYRLATKEELLNASSIYSNSGNLVTFKGKLLKIKEEIQSNKFSVFPISEMTLSDEFFNDQEDYEYIGFRCICEINK
jgi:hypothetical protein